METNEFVVSYDTNYTQLSSDNEGNYFDVYMNGLEPERYYTILIKSNIGNKISIDTRSKNIRSINWDIIEPVPVEENTGLDSRTEQFKGKINPYVIRRAPFDVFEVIYPLNKKSFVTKHKYSLLRLTVNSKNLQDEKNYLIEISIKENLKKNKYAIITIVYFYIHI